MFWHIRRRKVLIFFFVYRISSKKKKKSDRKISFPVPRFLLSLKRKALRTLYTAFMRGGSAAQCVPSRTAAPRPGRGPWIAVWLRNSSEPPGRSRRDRRSRAAPARRPLVASSADGREGLKLCASHPLLLFFFFLFLWRICPEARTHLKYLRK